MRRILTAIILVALVAVPARGLAQGIQEAAAEGFGDTPASDSKDRRVTIRFGYHVNLVAFNLTQADCLLRLPRGSDGVEVLRAAEKQSCIRSFSTERKRGRVLLDCINDLCAGVTNSPGVIPDTFWIVHWTGEKTVYGSHSEYWRWGLHRYAASEGDAFDCYLGLGN